MTEQRVRGDIANTITHLPLEPALSGRSAHGQAIGRIRILLVDGQALFREAMRGVLNRCRHITVVGEATLASEVAAAVARTQPDIVLTEFSLPDAVDGSVLAELKTCCPGVRVVVLTGLTEEAVLAKALTEGAHGCVRKGASGALVIKAIRAVAAGEMWVQREMMGSLAGQLRRIHALSAGQGRSNLLTPREMSVLKLLAAGNGTADIAQELSVSQSTVRVHITRIIEKLGVQNRVQAVLWAIREGMTQP